MNYADAERVASILQNLSFEKIENLEKADVVFLFTCSVRQKAEDKVFGELEKLRKWKSEKIGRKIGLTGCMVRRTSNQNSNKKDSMLHRSKILDFVWRIEDSEKLPQLLIFTDCELAQQQIKSPSTKFFSIQPKYSNPTQVLIPISTGCDNFCSYCIVPHARGREVSRSEREIIKECEKAVKNGAVEITLLGQNVNSYQKTRGTFAKLLAKIAKIPNLKRLRFISSHPKDFDESVIEVMATNKNIERHLHLPAQHGDDEILRKMNRNYTTIDYLKLLEKFRKQLPETSVTTDFIVGFPGETKKNFENLLNFYREANFDFAYFAKYSPRPETTAANFENQIPEKIKKSRFQTLNNLVVKTTSKKYSTLKNKTLEILVENCKKEVCNGRSSEFYSVKFEGAADLVGKMIKVKITNPREVELWGEISS